MKSEAIYTSGTPMLIFGVNTKKVKATYNLEWREYVLGFKLYQTQIFGHVWCSIRLGYTCCRFWQSDHFCKKYIHGSFRCITWVKYVVVSIPESICIFI
jgi:hypothetical protein